MPKKYNLADRRSAIAARRDAVGFLQYKGYSWKAIGYALGKTGEWARAVEAKKRRKEIAAAKERLKINS